MDGYDHKEIEKKWQERWQKDGTYHVIESADKEKYYVLDMFPYISGAGLHVGHPKGYIGTDVYSRYKRMTGKSVLHPMGWDAFGLPAENYAIKNKQHPSIAVEENIARFKEQLSTIGLDYDWSREINTTDPAYYKWTQWIFLQMWKKGLAYESNEPINWCPSCQTGLANEDLDKGRCERCGSMIEKRRIRQWVLAITKYADRLIEDLEGLNWPESIKEQQREWIGRSEGLKFVGKVVDMDLELETFSAHFEAVKADTFITIAADHPLLGKLIEGVSNEGEIRERIEEINLKRIQNKYDTGEVEGVFTGRYLSDPVAKRQMPIWVASFVLSDYATGVVRSSRFDARDLAFAEKYNIELDFSNLPESRERIEKELIEKGIAKKAVVYRLRDWVFSRQRYWGEPIPLIHCEKDGVVAVPEEELPVRLPQVKHYEPTGTGESPLAAIEEWVNVKCPKCGGSGKRETNTMPQWAGSSWYHLAYTTSGISNFQFPISKKNSHISYWLPVDIYVGGAEHATRHLIYARFWHKFLYDEGIVAVNEPFKRLKNVGLILASDGRKMSKRFGNVVNPDDVIERFGADTFRLYEMFLGPFSLTATWSDEAIIGPRRFLERVCELAKKPNVKAQSARILNKYVKKITSNIEEFKFNTAVSELMKCLNELENLAPNTYNLETFLRLLAPFAPHITEELWARLGHADSIHLSAWPVAEVEEGEAGTINLPVQIDGKVRGSIVIDPATSEEELRKIVLESPAFVKYLAGRAVKASFYKPGKVINILTK